MVLLVLNFSPVPGADLCQFSMQGCYLTGTTVITVVQLAGHCLQLAFASQQWLTAVGGGGGGGGHWQVQNAMQVPGVDAASNACCCQSEAWETCIPA